MDDEMILARGGDQHDIEQYAKEHGADLNEDDFRSKCCNARMVGGIQCEACGSNGE